MIYSVVILNETKYVNPCELKNKIFEEVVVLCDLEENFFDEINGEDMLEYFRLKSDSEIYVNANNQEVYTQVMAILDKFEILDKLKFNDYIEVYSRHFVEKPDFTIKNMIQKYYKGYYIFCEK